MVDFLEIASYVFTADCATSRGKKWTDDESTEPMGGGKSVLVSHRPVSTLDSRQKKLFTELQRLFPDQLIHIPVWINKAETFGREPTQRTRSFLYSALGAVVAQSVQAGGVRFYE